MMRSPRGRLIIVVTVLTALITLSIASRIAALRGQALATAPPERQTFDARIEATDIAGRLTANAYMSMGTIGPKFPEEKAASSCPQPTPLLGIWDFRFGPFSDGRGFVNEASARASTGEYYRIWAGAPDYIFQTGATAVPGAALEGLLRVFKDNLDPCAARRAGVVSQGFRNYKIPRGPLTILKIDGDVVEYGIEGGGTGRFNYVTGEFLP